MRTPEYRSGWDSIWGNRNGTNGENEDEAPRQRQAAHAGRPAKARKRREPITVTLDLDALHLFQPGPLEQCANTWMAGTSPAMTRAGAAQAIKDGLVEIARAELKKSRVSYERPRQGRRHRLAHHLPRGLRA